MSNSDCFEQFLGFGNIAEALAFNYRELDGIGLDAALSPKSASVQALSAPGAAFLCPCRRGHKMTALSYLPIVPNVVFTNFRHLKVSSGK